MADSEQQTSKPRRTKGTGGIAGPDKQGRYRGYRSINGQRVYTPWVATRFLAENAISGLKAPVQAPARTVRTVGQAIDAFIARAVITSATRGGYEVTARHYLAELRPLDVTELTRDGLFDFYDRMATEKKLALSTIRGAAAVMRGAMKYAHDSAWVTHNVTRGIQLPAAPRGDIDEISPMDRLAILAALKDHRLEALFRLGCLFTLRPGEVTGLRWSDVSFVDGTITVAGQLQRAKWPVDGVPLGTIYKATPKTKRGNRTIWPDGWTMELLGRWKSTQTGEAYGRQLTDHQVTQRQAQAARLAAAKQQRLLANPELYTVAPDDLVFTLPNGDPILPRHHADNWRDLLTKAGVKHTRLYAARHMAINHLLRSGADPAAVSVLAGHDGPEFTRRVYGGNLSTLAKGLGDLV